MQSTRCQEIMLFLGSDLSRVTFKTSLVTVVTMSATFIM